MGLQLTVQSSYRWVKRNCQVVRFRDFEQMRARMTQVFLHNKKTQLISADSKQKIEVRGQDLSRILKIARVLICSVPT